MIEDAVNRIYYSVFYAAKAMLNSLGYDTKTRTGLISGFGLRIVKARKEDKRLGVVLRKAFELRESADYHLAVTIDREEVEQLMRDAKYFLKEAKKFVSMNF